jgi:signal peptidase II
MAAGLGLVLGGTAGNLADRLLRQSVTDFMVVPFWPAIFNVADVGVRAGIVLALLALLWPRRGHTG